jgi:hypothetical protein
MMTPDSRVFPRRGEYPEGGRGALSGNAFIGSWAQSQSPIANRQLRGGTK